MEIEIVRKAGDQNKRGSLQSWIEEGYSIFSSEGPASIQVERVARNLKKNKSGFYYLFKDRENFMDCLLEEHLSRLNSMTIQIRKIQNFEAECFNFLIEHREEIFFQIQLVKNREIEAFQSALRQFNSRISTAIIPVWSDYLEASIEVSEKLWGMTRDSLFCRATKENYTYSWLEELIGEAKLIADLQDSQSMAR